MHTFKYLAVFSSLGLALAAQVVLAQGMQVQQPQIVDAKSVKFKDIGGPQLGDLWGDFSKGAHGSLLRLPQGFVSPSHLHTGDYDAVVIEGTVSNVEAGKKAIPLGPGSYFVQKGKVNHVTSCLSKSPCLIYVTQREAFDFITP
jgi:anti-sigma factor ChrR (cupin superfamily)